MKTSWSWEDNFPKGYGHTSLAYLRRCQGFAAAKTGDMEAARYVVSRCVKPSRLDELRSRHPRAKLIPVTGKNKLPLALALEIGLPIWNRVFLLQTVHRKALCAIQRLLHKPAFTGRVQENAAYILVDDVITQGGTVAALRDFVLNRGGKVVAVVALAYAIGSHAIAPSKKYTVRLIVKFGTALVLLLDRLGIVSSFCALTNAQVKYLLRFTSVRNIKRRMARYGAAVD